MRLIRVWRALRRNYTRRGAWIVICRTWPRAWRDSEEMIAKQHGAAEGNYGW